MAVDYQKSASQMVTSFKRAATRLTTAATGQPGRDSSLKLYETLTPDDFEMIGHVYGREELMRYIRTMEHKRAGGK